MTGGRQKPPRPELIDVPLNEEAMVAVTASLNAVGTHQRETSSAVFEIAKRLDYEGSLNPDDLEAGLKADKEEAGRMVFRMGARLLLLREQCPHGEFLERAKRAGFQPREAQRTMQATLAFCNPNASTSTHLATEKIQAFSKSKVFELLTLEDKEIVTLNEEGSVRGITLDEMDRMSVSELRAKLKQAEEATKAAKAEAAANLQAKDQLLATVRERANKAEEQLSAFQTNGIPADQKLLDFRSDIERVGRKADEHLVEVSNMVAVIDDYLTQLFDPDAPQDFDRHNAIMLAQTARDVGLRMSRWAGRVQHVIETSIYPLVEAEEMYLPFTDGERPEGE